MSTSTLVRSERGSGRLWLMIGSSVIVVAILAALLWFLLPLRERRLVAQADAAAKAADPPSPPLPNTVVLSKEKIEAAGIALGEAKTDSLPAELTVPGKIEANPARRVDIRTRVPGIVREVEVNPGQDVKEGEQLITLESADVATARLNVHSKLRDLAVRRFEYDWKAEVEQNVEELIVLLRKNVPAATLEKDFANKPLGSDRSLLISAYSDLEIAMHEEIKQSSFFTDKIVGEHPMLLAKHARESAQAKYEAALEQVRQDARLEKRMAEQQFELAKSNVIDSAQRLRLLGVQDPLPDLAKLESPAQLPGDLSKTDELSIYLIKAPFAGTILARNAVFSQRAEPTDVLLSLADLSKVWVVASIPESGFGLLPSLKDATIRMTATAYPGKSFSAKVLYTSADVDPTTRSVRIVAETENPNFELRLGMFVQIVLGTSAVESALTIPTTAVVEIDGKTGVFLPANAHGSFVFRPVELGRENAGKRVVTRGLSKNEKIVAKGAFTLKSELILQNEPDDE